MPRFSLRVLLVMVVCAGVGLGVWRHVTRSERAVERLRERGAYIFRRDGSEGEPMPDGGPTYGMSFATPRWRGEDRDIRWLYDVHRLHNLTIYHPSVGISCLDTISNLHDLRVLSFYGAHKNPIAADLSAIAEVKSLQSLVIGNWRLENAGLKWLAELPEVESLHLAYLPGITGDALSSLPPNVTYLSLVGLALDDASLRHLTAYPRLRALTLDQLPVTDAGLVTCAKIPSLRFLTIQKTNMTPASVDALLAVPGPLRVNANGQPGLSQADKHRLALEGQERHRGLPRPIQ